MRKKITAFLLTLIILVSTFVPTFASSSPLFDVVNDVAQYVEGVHKFGQTAEMMKNRALRYLLETGDNNIDNVLKAMFEGMDDYSVYFTEEEFKEFNNTVNASLCGIGVSYHKVKSGIAITSILPGSPAEKAGLKVFDVITSVDGIDIFAKTTDEISMLVKGAAGSSVKLGIDRFGIGKMNFNVVRANVEQNPVTWSVVDDETAYISLSLVTLNSDVYMEKALKEIDALGIKKIILDLRGNSGGYLGATVNICGLFMPEGPVGSMEYKHKSEVYYSYNKNPKYKLAVLIDGDTASGAEFISGGLQDSGVARLFGEQSYGKGTMQTTREIVTGGAIKVTVAKYYTAKGQDVHVNHINPDVEVKNAYRRLSEEGFLEIDFDANITIGSVGNGVLAIEQRLAELGYIKNADTYFDDGTMNAVRLFKAQKGMDPTPVVDIEFTSYLNSIEYNNMYELIDYQAEAAYEYLKGVK